MHIQITARQFHASERLHEYTKKKIQRLDKFYDGITGVNVIMSKEGQPEENSVEMSASVHRQQLVAQAKGKTHEEAIDECVDRLKRQVVRYKDKLRNVKREKIR
ncbi:MAG: ribosome-associated translation inhibitor RaiA [Rhodothermales bacterium]|nr:ribosome-associated translation inhibitor RaiA [Rhodothermales bacterium]MBO6779176.1 ribosome-associated translation inhibitor RaiA [Rhodothermales bacterium]